MNKGKLRIFAILMAFALAAVSAVRAEAQLKIRMTNKTDARIFVAVSEMSTGGDSSGDYTKGWYAVDPGKTKLLKLDGYSPVCAYFYYAISMGGKRVWRGRKGDDGANFWIHPTKAFTVRGNDRIRDGKLVRFRYLGVDTKGNASITFITKK